MEGPDPPRPSITPRAPFAPHVKISKGLGRPGLDVINLSDTIILGNRELLKKHIKYNLLIIRVPLETTNAR